MQSLRSTAKKIKKNVWCCFWLQSQFNLIFCLMLHILICAYFLYKQLKQILEQFVAYYKRVVLHVDSYQESIRKYQN